jgi:hypothetical protein
VEGIGKEGGAIATNYYSFVPSARLVTRINSEPESVDKTRTISNGSDIEESTIHPWPTSETLGNTAFITVLDKYSSIPFTLTEAPPYIGDIL